ncbi:MAG: SDR family oxidoreductase [Proteobacteria bacterium]|nr:SDR family oxidoreductase [Pseudomonadota bacterium]
MADAFAGKGIIVTGGGNGLGRATALMLATRGGRVAVLDIDKAAAEATVAAAGGNGVALVGDITRKEPAFALFGQAAAALGRVDALVNCAGVYPRRPILEINDEDWEFSFSVNVRGTHYMCAAAAAHMQGKGGGRIVNVASIDAFKAHAPNAHYAAMKAAVVSLTRSFGAEFARDGILVNAVAPAAIATEKAKQSDWLAEHARNTPIGRAAEPDDIADVICFLASEANRYIAGETVVVSGAYLIR